MSGSSQPAGPIDLSVLAEQLKYDVYNVTVTPREHPEERTARLNAERADAEHRRRVFLGRLRHSHPRRCGCVCHDHHYATFRRQYAGMGSHSSLGDYRRNRRVFQRQRKQGAEVALTVEE